MIGLKNTEMSYKSKKMLKTTDLTLVFFNTKNVYLIYTYFDFEYTYLHMFFEHLCNK